MTKDQEQKMQVILWEMGRTFCALLLWDGENTYWSEHMKPSPYPNGLQLDKIYRITGSRFTYIGDL